MLDKQNNSIVTLAIFLALVGVSKPAKAFLLAQADVAPTTFTVPDKLPEEATVKIVTSNSTRSIDQSLKESFTTKYPQAKVNLETQGSKNLLQTLASGKSDLVGIGRELTAAEKQKGFVAVPVSREKIAVVISKDNPYDGNLTISQFAQIFRGEITDWSEIGGNAGPISLIDLPDTNDTRQAFPNYPVFQEGEFATGSNAIKIDQDSTDAMISQLGANAISYAVANDVINRDDVKVVTMHQTQPGDPRYPFSQPFYLVYQGNPSEATKAFLGFATTEAGEEVVANRVGSLSTAAATAISSKLGNKPADAPSGSVDLPETTVDGEGEVVEPETIGEVADAEIDSDAIVEDETVDAEIDPDAIVEDETVDAEIDPDAIVEDETVDAEIDPDAIVEDETVDAEIDPNAIVEDETVDAEIDPDAVAEDETVDAEIDSDAIAGIDTADTDSNSGEVNSELDGSGEVNSELDGSGEVNSELDGSGEVNSELDGSGEVNPELDGSGEVNPELDGSGESNATINSENSEIIVPNEAEGDGTVATAKKGRWWWWLPLIIGIPVLALVALSGFGRGKKSDREPAISDISNANFPDGDGGIPVRPNGGDLSAIGTGVAVNEGNVARSTAGTNSSRLSGETIASGTAMAGGATATNLVGKKETVEDEVELFNAESDEPIVEIPSNPVTEFTGQETDLQTTNQPTKIQTDVTDQSTTIQTDPAEDLDNTASGLLDGISTPPSTVAGGAAALGGAAAVSSFLNDQENTSEETVEGPVFESENPTLLQTDSVRDRTTTLQAKDDVYLDSVETNESQEFDGDFILDEETISGLSQDLETETTVETSDADLETNVDSSIDSSIDATTGALDSAALEGAALSGAAATSNLSTNRDSQDTTDISEVDLDTSAELSNSEGFADNVIADAGTTSDDLDLEGINLDDFESSADISLEEITLDDLDRSDTNLERTNLDNTESSADIDLEEITLDDLDRSDTNLEGTNLDNTQSSADISLEEITFDDLDHSDTNLEGTNLDNTESSADIDLEEITLDDLDRSDTNLEGTNLDNTESSADIDLEEITFDDVDNSDTNLEGTNLDNTQSSADIDLEEITLDDLDRSDTNLEGTNLDNTESSADIDLEEITFDDLDRSDTDLEGTNLDNTESSADIDLEEITFDDLDRSDTNLEGTNLDNTESSADIDLEEITFDDVDNSINSFIDDLDIDGKPKNIDINDLGFEESTDSSASDSLSINPAEITDISNDNSDDMNDISAWLDSLETPNQSSEDISEWLDRLNIDEDSLKSQKERNNISKTEVESSNDIEDISFQFLEDLLERDSKKNQDG